MISTTLAAQGIIHTLFGREPHQFSYHARWHRPGHTKEYRIEHEIPLAVRHTMWIGALRRSTRHEKSSACKKKKERKTHQTKIPKKNLPVELRSLDVVAESSMTIQQCPESGWLQEKQTPDQQPR